MAGTAPRALFCTGIAVPAASGACAHHRRAASAALRRCLHCAAALGLVADVSVRMTLEAHRLPRVGVGECGRAYLRIAALALAPAASSCGAWAPRTWCAALVYSAAPRAAPGYAGSACLCGMPRLCLLGTVPHRAAAVCAPACRALYLFGCGAPARAPRRASEWARVAHHAAARAIIAPTPEAVLLYARTCGRVATTTGVTWPVRKGLCVYRCVGATEGCGSVIARLGPAPAGRLRREHASARASLRVPVLRLYALCRAPARLRATALTRIQLAAAAWRR